MKPEEYEPVPGSMDALECEVRRQEMMDAQLEQFFEEAGVSDKVANVVACCDPVPKTVRELMLYGKRGVLQAPRAGPSTVAALTRALEANGLNWWVGGKSLFRPPGGSDA